MPRIIRPRLRLAYASGMTFADRRAGAPRPRRMRRAPWRITSARWGCATAIRTSPSNVADAPTWIEQTNRFYYRRTVKGGHEFVLVDAETQAKEAGVRSREARRRHLVTPRVGKYTAVELPFTTFTFVDNDARSSSRSARRSRRRRRPRRAGSPGGRAAVALLARDYTCRPPARRGGPGRTRRPRRRRTRRPGPAGLRHQRRRAEEVPRRQARSRSSATTTSRSAKPASASSTLLSTDGSEGGYYDPESLVWSPGLEEARALQGDARAIRRYVHYVESSPEDQLQPKHSTMQYAKPGDVLDVETPVIFDVDDEEADSRSTTRCSQRVRHVAARVAQGQRGGHVRVQPARPPGLPRDRDRRRHGSAARGHQRGAEDLLLLLGQELPAATSPTARKSSGCRSATAGTTSISTTARPAR